MEALTPPPFEPEGVGMCKDISKLDAVKTIRKKVRYITWKYGIGVEVTKDDLIAIGRILEDLADLAFMTASRITHDGKAGGRGG